MTHANVESGVGNATLAQFRILGGTLGIAVTTCAATPLITSQLLSILPIDVVTALLDRTDGINSLPNEAHDKVRSAFAQGYNLQMQILIGVAAAHLPAILMMWSRKRIVIGQKATEET